MQDGEGIWVFAYGSLMWNPGCEPRETRPARLSGWHRAMCILSHRYRGTVGRPGLVLGLDRGGSCLGRALRIDAAAWNEVRAAMDERELVTGVYLPRFVPARLDDGRRVPAYAYVADRTHPQYWRGPPDQAAAMIRQGEGSAGRSLDYLASTVRHLEGLGIREGALRRLLESARGPG